MTAAFAQKLGMTHIYDDKNRHVPVTILKLTPQVITAVKTTEKDGYNAIQFGTEGAKHVAKPQQDDLTKNNIDLRIAHRKEVRVDDDTQANIGQTISAADFATGDLIMVTGTSKGKGFAGTIKRHNFSRGPETHGSKNVRKPGSIGGGYPQRVVKGRKMAGHMGNETVTTKGLKIMAINEADNTLAVSGPIPGSNKTRVFIQKIEK
jgi:large subunit ribosomal protein L3